MNFFKELFTFQKLYIYSFIAIIHGLVQAIFILSMIYAAFTEGELYLILMIIPVFIIIRFMFEFWIVLFSINDKIWKILENTKNKGDWHDKETDDLTKES